MSFCSSIMCIIRPPLMAGSKHAKPRWLLWGRCVLSATFSLGFFVLFFIVHFICLASCFTLYLAFCIIATISRQCILTLHSLQSVASVFILLVPYLSSLSHWDVSSQLTTPTFHSLLAPVVLTYFLFSLAFSASAFGFFFYFMPSFLTITHFVA